LQSTAAAVVVPGEADEMPSSSTPKKTREPKADKQKSLASTKTAAQAKTAEPAPKKATASRKKSVASPAATVQTTARTSISTPSSLAKVEVVDLTNDFLPGPVLEKLAQVKEAASKESFLVKKIFPPTLKPILSEAASLAMDYNVLNPTFFQHLTAILPYNTYTLRVLLLTRN
jgi:hypothetical protein